ncbi:MAG: class I SAM-dependent methyltransferase [Vicinamibacteraceae bacterium]
MPLKISHRIEAAVALLNPRPGERLLEIGCGTGQAIQAVVARCPTASVIAIDRSEKAVARARVVNAEAVDARQVSVSVDDVERGPIAPGSFDRAFAIRVNSFWTRPGVALPHAAASLRPHGELWMIYDASSPKIVPIMASLRAFGMQDVRSKSAAGAFAIIGKWDGLAHRQSTARVSPLTITCKSGCS